MIDIENDVFSMVAQAVKQQYPDVFLSGEHVQSPAEFPCISLVEWENIVFQDTQSSTQTENHAEVTYELNVYSNKTDVKKEECKELAAFVDEILSALGFTRTMLNPVSDPENTNYYRMTGRYKAIVSANRTIFRR